MAFPDTRLSLVQRLVTSGEQKDWHQFLKDYWSPVCKFAAYLGSISSVDAEDVASLTFEVILVNQLLARWSADRTVKLRTLLCGVVRKILANRRRVEQSREKILQKLAQEGLPAFLDGDRAYEDQDKFYAAWADSLIEETVQALFQECYAQKKGDHFRVLYSRVCEDQTMAAISESLLIPITSVESHYRAVSKRLAAKFEAAVHAHIQRYCSEESFDEEWQSEWDRLGQYLKQHGGLEECLRRVSTGRKILADRERTAKLINSTIERARRD